MISNSFPTVDEENENEIRDDNQVQCDLQKFRVKRVKLFLVSRKILPIGQQQ